jgi:hypothetical protein
MSANGAPNAGAADAPMLEIVDRLEKSLDQARSSQRREASLLDAIVQDCRRLRELVQDSPLEAAKKATAVLSRLLMLKWQPHVEKTTLVAVAEAFNHPALSAYGMVNAVASNIDVVKAANSFPAFFCGGFAPVKAGLSLLILSWRSMTPEKEMRIQREQLRKTLSTALFLYHEKDVLLASRAALLVGELCHDHAAVDEFIANGTCKLMEELVVKCGEFGKRSREDSEVRASEDLVADRLDGLSSLIYEKNHALCRHNYERMLSVLIDLMKEYPHQARIMESAARILLVVFNGLAEKYSTALASATVAELPQILATAMAAHVDGADETPSFCFVCCFAALCQLARYGFSPLNAACPKLIWRPSKPP